MLWLQCSWRCNRANPAASNFLATPDRRVRSPIVVCKNPASRVAPRRFRAAPVLTCRSRCRQSEIWVERFSERQRRLGGAGRANAQFGTKLSKTCPMLEPFKQATLGARCLIFDLELLDVGRLGFGSLDPFLHLRQPHDHFGIGLDP